MRGYVNWALTSKKLRPDTVKVYLSDLKLAHKLKDEKIEFENDFFINAMLKGAKNVSLYTEPKQLSKIRNVFSFTKINWSRNCKK